MPTTSLRAEVSRRVRRLAATAPPGLHALALAVTVAAACRSDDHAPSDRSPYEVRNPTDVSAEKPVWQFGEETTRADALPAELDSMRAWGDYAEGTRPVAYGVDLTGDGGKEWFVRADRSVCGRAGCPTALMTRAPDGRFVDVLEGLVRAVYVTNRRAGGWPVLWARVGGRDGGVFRMEFRNGRYELSRMLSRTKDAAEEWTAADDSLMALLSAAPSP